jgi:hypothetical protein
MVAQLDAAKKAHATLVEDHAAEILKKDEKIRELMELQLEVVCPC